MDLLEWFGREGRELPWRSTSDPYRIWVSEVILQQTRIAQGTAYYHRFLERYPTLQALAASSESDLLLVWQGLGYYSRALNMLSTAQTIVERYGGVFPRQSDEVAALKGVGPYTHAAIMSMAYGEPYAVVDGNVYRVISRLLATDTPIDTSVGQRAYRYWAQQLLSPDTPGAYNQAIMDLGSMVCTPHTPLCNLCPVQHHCCSCGTALATQLPLKAKRTAVRELFLDFFMVIIGDSFVVERRDRSGIWKGLYQFPLLISEQQHADLLELDLSAQFHCVAAAGVVDTYVTRHLLTHRCLHIRIHTLHAQTLTLEGASRYTLVPLVQHTDYAFPRPLRAFLDHTWGKFASSR